MLYVVATPIGNMGDITARAREILQSADLILAEDTRHSGVLLSNLGIRNRLVSYHDHNESQRVPEIIERLKQGQNIALISDAGTPLVADPGYRIVRACREAGIPVSPVPGPCAAIAALSVSGLATDRFLFEGFVPPKGGKRTRALQRIVDSEITTIVYESPYRIKKLVTELSALDPNRQAVMAREITKKFEEVTALPLIKLREFLEKQKVIKGEFVLLLEGRAKVKEPSVNDFQ